MSRRALLSLCLISAVAWAAPKASLPNGPEVEAAKAAYNKGDYTEAARRFLGLCQAQPMEPSLYRALARARVYSGQPVGAVIAYRLYLQLAPEAADKDKITAELGLALQQIKTPPPDGPPPGPAAKLQAAVERAKLGQFTGPTGAFALYDEALKRGMLGPALLDAQEALSAALIERSQALFEAWWALDVALDAADLKEIASAWRLQAKRRLLRNAEIKPVAVIEGLERFKARDWEGVISALAPVAGGDARLRYAQILALAELKRLDEAQQLLAVIMREA
ncbi:hypothetical protein KJ940_03225, partial [Myxococcota bacterium]|nr:hypothetical protein [Myxococcota bacterium]